MHAAKLVPIFRMVGKIGQRFAFAMLANLGQLASVLATFLGDARVDARDQRFGNRVFAAAAPFDSPPRELATLTPPFGGVLRRRQYARWSRVVVADPS